MTRRSTLQHTLTAAVAASALATAPALAKPADYPYESSTSSLAGTTSPQQDLRSPDARDAAQPKAAESSVAPGTPTWPVQPEPLTRPVPPAESATGNGGGDDSIWLVLGLGLGGAGLLAGGAAGLARHSRVRARRVAV